MSETSATTEDPYAPVPPNDLLSAAIASNLTDVLVIGREPDGSMYYASSTADKGKMLLWMEWCRFYLISPKTEIG